MTIAEQFDEDNDSLLGTLEYDTYNPSFCIIVYYDG